VIQNSLDEFSGSAVFLSAVINIDMRLSIVLGGNPTASIAWVTQLLHFYLGLAVGAFVTHA